MVQLDPSLFPSDPEFLLLDIGPGSGAIAQIYSRDRRVVAVEPEASLARQVADRSSPLQLSSCRGSGYALPIRDAAIDGATVLEVLEHVDDPDAILAEAHRVLKPGGALCVSVPTSYTEAMYSRLHPDYMTNATHVRIFKKGDLVQRVERAGFVLERVSTEQLEPALSWLGHSIMRSDSDATGLIKEHHWIDARLARFMARLSRTPGLWRVVPWARQRFGKSWYFYARKRSS